MKGIISISDYKLSCSVGIYPHEKFHPQELLLTLELGVEMPKSDSIDETIDYDKVVKLCVEIAGKKHFNLIETLAGELLSALFSQFPVHFVKVRVAKPGAIALAKAVAIEIERSL